VVDETGRIIKEIRAAMADSSGRRNGLFVG
jgi:hypothetical protein